MEAEQGLTGETVGLYFGPLKSCAEELIEDLNQLGCQKKIASSSLKNAITVFVELLQDCVYEDQWWMMRRPLEFSQNTNELRRLGKAVVLEAESSIPGYKNRSDVVARGAANETSLTKEAQQRRKSAESSKNEEPKKAFNSSLVSSKDNVAECFDYHVHWKQMLPNVL